MGARWFVQKGLFGIMKKLHNHIKCIQILKLRALYSNKTLALFIYNHAIYYLTLIIFSFDRNEIYKILFKYSIFTRE